MGLCGTLLDRDKGGDVSKSPRYFSGYLTRDLQATLATEIIFCGGYLFRVGAVATIGETGKDDRWAIPLYKVQ